MHQLITLDLRHKEIQGFFDFTVDNLRGAPFLLAHIREKVWGLGRETTEGLHSMSKLKTCKCVCTYVCLCVWFQISDYRNGVVVARSPAVTRRYIHMSSSPFTALCISLSHTHTLYTHTHSRTRRANAYAERLRLGLAVIHGESKDGEPEEEEDDDGRNSPPPLCHTHSTSSIIPGSESHPPSNTC